MSRPPAEFDQFAESYHRVHAENLRASGEQPEYFAEHKLSLVRRVLGEGFALPILDYGSGIGNLTSRLASAFPSVHGYDPSTECTRVARERAPSAQFHDHADALPERHFGAIILANVLHHVEPPDRPALLERIRTLLAPGGRLVVFEHNPLNPLARRAVATCPLDESAVLLYPWELTRSLRRARFESIRRDFIVFFPRPLAPLRPLERWLRGVPIGAQVCVTARSPS